MVVDVKEIAVYKSGISYPHDMLIYGFDHNNREFCIADFFNGSKYECGIAGYDEVLSAISNMSVQYEQHWIFFYDIILLSVKKTGKRTLALKG